MMQVLTDEEAVAHYDALVDRVAKAIACTRLMHPDASVEALAQVLFMVNGQDWMGATDMARVRLKAKALGPSDT